MNLKIQTIVQAKAFGLLKQKFSDLFKSLQIFMNFIILKLFP